MNAGEFYNYLMANFSLGGTAGRLVRNIIEYVDQQDFADAKDAHTHLSCLLDAAFGLEQREIRLFRANPCELCGEYKTDHHPDDYHETTLICSACAEKQRRN